jgi:ribonuclease P protein component
LIPPKKITGSLSRFTKKEVDAFFKVARRVVRHQGLYILVAPAQRDYGRILVIASRKVGNAPTRNKVRRQFKAIFYEQNYYTRGLDCVIIMKKEGAQLPFATLQELLARAFPNSSPK